LPIRDYAAIGDGRTVALVGRDGAVDWLCLPDVDSASVFAALLDPERGGRFTLAPSVAFESERRYVPQTNVLETTFTTATGVVRVTDAMTLPRGGLVPYRELVRRVEGLAGDVPMRWSVEPRFAYGARRRPFALHGDVPVAAYGRDAVAVLAWDAGAIELGNDAVEGRFSSRSGKSSLLVLSAAHKEPLVFPPRHEVESRLEGTVASWRRGRANAATTGAGRTRSYAARLR